MMKSATTPTDEDEISLKSIVDGIGIGNGINGDDEDNDDRIQLLRRGADDDDQTTRTITNERGAPQHNTLDDEFEDFNFWESYSAFKRFFTREHLKLWFSSLLYTYKQFFKFTQKDIRTKKVSYCIGLSSCFIVVWMVVMCVTALDQVPIIFLRLAELDAGEFDLRVRASPYVPGVSLSYHSVIESVRGPKTTPEDHRMFSYFAPRLIMGAVTATAPSSCAQALGFNPNQNDVHNASSWEWMYYGFNQTKACGLPPAERTLDELSREDFNHGQFCVPALCTNQVAETMLVIYDHDIERKMQMGREWSHRKLGEAEVYVTDGVAKELLLNDGDTIILTIPLMDQFIGPFRNAGMISPDPEVANSRVTFNDGNIHFPAKVVKVFDYTKYYGKLSTQRSSAIFMEYSHIMKHISKFLAPQLFNNETAKQLAQVDLYEFAEYIYFNHPPSRLDVYNENDYNVVQKKIVDFASKGLYLVGYNQVQSEFPVLEYMRNTRFFALFLGLIISIIVTILTTLSVILIYSLLMINVENRTFEMGVLRMIGLNKAGVIQLILIQAFFYAIPGWIIGIAIGQASFIGVSVLLGNILQIKVSVLLTIRAVGLATLLGILIPLISSVLPIWTALGQNLTESLDVSRSKTKAVKYSIDRASENNVSWTSIFVGAILAIFGAGVYYFFPLALLSLNLSFLLYMFFGLLLAMLLGLIILSLNLENMIEFVVTWTFFFWENYAVRDIVTKNLVAHRLRNRKTTIMFSLSLGFIIFLTLSFQSQIRTFQYNVLRLFGTRINLQARHTGAFTPLYVRRSLESICQSEPACRNFTYISYNFHDVTPYQAPTIRSRGKYQGYTQDIFAVSPNFYDVTGNAFLVTESQVKPHERFKVYGKSLSYLLYTLRGSFSMLIGSLYELNLDLNLDSTFVIEEPRRTERYPRYEYRLLKPLAFLSASPVGAFSKFPLQSRQTNYVSFPTFVRLSNGSISTVDSVPIQKMLISLREDVAATHQRALFKRLQNFCRVNALDFKDMNTQLSPLSIATQVLDFFFIFTTVVAMTICFFSLMSSMFSNINEQAKEIGILRAIGARKWAIVRIFIYEAFILIISASLMGILIGLSIGYTMALQNSLFTQLPVDFIIPWMIILVVFGLAILFSLISSLGPILSLLRLPIVTILRRLVA